MAEYEKMVKNLIKIGDPMALSDAFDVCRELELVDSMVVEGTGRREKPTTVYDEENFRLAHDLNREVRAESN